MHNPSTQPMVKSKAHQAVAILVSPGPVDGYPPVQHQCRLLAQSGIHVALITVPRLQGAGEIAFSYPGVENKLVALREGQGWVTGVRVAEFVTRLTALRRRYLGHPVVEIAFDPLAMFYSDLALFRPAYRIAHFHEALDGFETSWMQARLKKSIGGFSDVVCPDATRASILADQLHLSVLPWVVPNYPLLDDDACEPWNGEKNPPFEVIYAGSIGPDHKQDFMLKSLALWPKTARLTLIGNDQLPFASSLSRQAAQLGVADRFQITGWMDYGLVNKRLSRAHLGIAFFDPSILNWRVSLGASNKRYEYMRAGLPQISDMNPGVCEMVESLGIGRCIRNFLPEELACLVSEYIDFQDRCFEHGCRAYEMHRTKFNYNSAFQPLLEKLRETLQSSLKKAAS